MSVSVDKTMKIKPKNLCQVLWQIIRTLCFNPKCCSDAPGLLISSPGVLGTIQIFVGLVNIALGPGRTSTHSGDLASLGAPYWLGGVYVVAGILCILAGRFPSKCLVGFTVFLNLAGGIFAITAVVLYALDLSSASVLWMCDGFDRRGNAETRMQDGVKRELDDKCRDVAMFAERMVTAMDILLIILAVLQLCVNISTSILGIKALINPPEREEEAYESMKAAADRLPC